MFFNDNKVDMEKVLTDTNKYLDKINDRLDKSLEIIEEFPKKYKNNKK